MTQRAEGNKIFRVLLSLKKMKLLGGRSDKKKCKNKTPKLSSNRPDKKILGTISYNP